MSLGVIGWYFDWDWTAAEQAFHRAIEFNPNSALVHQHYGVFLATMERTLEAVAEQKLRVRSAVGETRRQREAKAPDR